MNSCFQDACSILSLDSGVLRIVTRSPTVERWHTLHLKLYLFLYFWLLLHLRRKQLLFFVHNPNFRQEPEKGRKKEDLEMVTRIYYLVFHNAEVIDVNRAVDVVFCVYQLALARHIAKTVAQQQGY